MRIGVDAMGGDRGPDTIVAGALAGREFLGEDDHLVLVGDERIILDQLGEAANNGQVVVVHTEEVIGMGESPVEALRAKQKSSIAVMTEMHREGQLDACISAGNTGACVAAAQMRLHRLAGVSRPGIAVLAPTFHGPVALCDVGANVNCRPKHLHQYGVMTSLYMEAMCGMDAPRVGLLSVGEEEGKGNELVKKTGDLLKDDPHVNFVGNVQGSDLLRGVCDVMICEGFVGNVVLKLVEGLGMGLVRAMLEQFQQIMPDQMQQVGQAFQQISHMYDFNLYGGAPLLGVDGIWIICHGASKHGAIKHAVREAKTFRDHRVNERITEKLSESGK
jgi:glycerol-3-phosphate acyltransferase PlsX